MEILYTAASAAGLAAALVAILAFLTTVFFAFKGQVRGLRPPGFIVGILPSEEERLTKNISKSSVVEFKSIHEEKFNSEYLAEKNASDSEMPSLLRNKNRCRYIPANTGDVIKLPIIIQNVGKKQADWYTLVITFNTPSVAVVDVKTEYLEVDALFVHDERYFIDREILELLNAPEDIRQSFADLKLPHDFICFTGILEAKVYEMVYLKLRVMENIDHFFVSFRIDCPAWIAKTQVWLQPVRVKEE